MDLSQYFSVDAEHIYIYMVQISTAFFLAFPIALDREIETKSVGLRTFPLVSVASCSFVLIGINMMDSPEAQARIISGVITGIGFIGGGSIIKSDSHVDGTATAAAIWITGAIGIAVALHYLSIAIALSILTFATFFIIGQIKRYFLKKENLKKKEAS